MSPRRAQRGLVRGCCLLGVVALVLLGFAVFLADRALAAPDLGRSLQGPDHGESETAIAVSLGTQLALALLTQPHAVVTLSEHDLTILAAAHPPSDVTGLTARVREGRIVLSGQHPFGPFNVSPVARVVLNLDVTQSPPSLTSRVAQLDIGQLGLPGFIQDRILGSFGSTIDLNAMFNSSPALEAVRGFLECVSVAPDGVRVGVHRLGIAVDTAVCGS
ncbi:MAG: hypothetical protein ACREN2_02585 [Candidatus Dormibacteria bacterium]